jgi:deazaflavin-dependent oxidoreductase (nitroreductase family)
MSDFSVPEHLPDWIREHVRRYLATNGADGHLWDSSERGGPGPIPTLLLVTRGRKTGKPLTLPLIYGESGGKYVVIASKGGAPAHPAWYLNLVDHPEVSVQVGAKRFRARARTAKGEEREKYWKQLAAIFAPYDAYQKLTQREIPVVVLEPVS